MKPNETSQMATVRIARYLAVNSIFKEFCGPDQIAHDIAPVTYTTTHTTTTTHPLIRPFVRPSIYAQFEWPIVEPNQTVIASDLPDAVNFFATFLNYVTRMLIRRYMTLSSSNRLNQ